MDIWIPLVGGALGGAVITSIFGFVKNHQDKVNEHAQWLRNQKIDVYTDVLRQSHISVHEVRAAEHGLKQRKKALKDFTDPTNSRLLVVGSLEVRNRVRHHFFQLERAFEAVGTGDGLDWSTVNNTAMWLEEAIRKDLDVVEKQAIKHTVRAWLYRYLVYSWRDPLDKRYYRKHGHARVHRKLNRPPA